MSANGKWMYNATRDNYWMGEFYNSRKEAITAGRKDEDIKGTAFYIGRREDIKITACVDSEHVIDEISRNIDDNYSSEFDFEERFYNEAMAHYESLQEKLENTVNEWLAEHKFDIGYVVKSIEKINTKEAE